MTKILAVTLLLFSTLAFGQPEASRTSSDSKELFRILKNALEEKKNTKPSLDDGIYQEYRTDDSPCSHCPPYIKLIREVNRIVEKFPETNESLAAQNESLIQLNRLKFMYYEVKLAEENGKTKCIQYQHSGFPQLFSKDNTTLLAEEALALPNVTSLQYVPTGKEQEIRYFYRGEGTARNILIEVSIFPDRKAVIRYHKYKDPLEMNLPDLGSSNSDSILNAPLGEAPLVDEKERVAGVGSLNVTSKRKAKLNKQSLGIAVEDSGGKDWVRLDVTHQSLKDVRVSTVVPIEWNLDDEGLKIGGVVRYDGNTNYKEKTTEQKKTVELALTDHNHEYMKTTFVSREDADQLIIASRYSVGSLGSVSGIASADSNGRKEFSLSHEIQDEKSSMTTRLGMSSDAKRFFELQRAQKIDKDQSMVLTIRANDRRETAIIYQYRRALR
jgi:hypothetical protein